jgi:putative DNA primase/helicase
MSASGDYPTARKLANALGAKRCGRGWSARCPGHNDRTPSLSISEGDGGKVLFHCHAGCDQNTVIEALRRQGLWPEPEEKKRGRRTNGNDDEARVEHTWRPMIPPRSGTADPPAELLSGFDVVHEYTDLHDRVTHYVGRIEARGGRRKTFVPITYGELNGRMGWHHKAPKAPRPLYGLNRLTAMPDASVLLCEGEKAANVAQQLFLHCVCLSWFGGVESAKYADVAPLKERDVILWPDNDPPGHAAVATLKEMLPHARVLRVDDLAESADAADVFPDDPEKWLKARIEPETVKTGCADKPTIQVIAGMVDIHATQAEDALLSSGFPIFQRGEALVRPAQWEVDASNGRTTLTAGLKIIGQPALIDLLAQAAVWTRFDGRKQAVVRTDPPAKVAAVLLSRVGFWRAPRVIGVITTPTLRRDGSVLAEAGYDVATRLYHVRDPALLLPPGYAATTRKAAMQSLTLLAGLLSGFPFVDDVSRSIALSSLITPVVRGALGMVPLHAFSAPAPGSGKSYLADVASTIAAGRICPVLGAAKTEEEREKKLAMMLIKAAPIISIDNLSDALGGDLLCQAIERPIVQLRTFGKLEGPEIECRATFFGNGNNLVIEGDTTRRVLLGLLDAGVERPELRQFKFKPVKRVLANRGAYIAACLCIVRSYMAAGCPDQLPELASFETWSNTVRSALVWLGCADPVTSMQTARDTDPKLGALHSVAQAWRAHFGSEPRTAAEVCELFARGFDPTGPDGAALTNLRTALAEVAGIRGVIDSNRLGYWLRKNKNRIAGRLKFTPDGLGHGGGVRWIVAAV